MGERDRERPIFSSRAEDPALLDAIESFCVGLAERIDHLQDAECEADLRKLARLARDLAREGGTVGYESFERVALAVADAAGAEKGEEARAQLVALTALARRIRLGHPGAF